MDCDACEGSGFGEADDGYCDNCDGTGEVKIIPPPVEYHRWARTDAYGIYTGLYCDDCFKDNYPYKTDMYHDPMDAGERMEPDDSLPWENQ